MNKEQAMQILRQVTEQISMPLEAHKQVLTALSVLEGLEVPKDDER